MIFTRKLRTLATTAHNLFTITEDDYDVDEWYPKDGRNDQD
jgi:hypothetical protein